MDYITEGLNAIGADQALIDFVMASRDDEVPQFDVDEELGHAVSNAGSCDSAVRIMKEWLKVNANLPSANGRVAASLTWIWLTHNSALGSDERARYEEFLADSLGASSHDSVPKGTSWTVQARYSLAELVHFMHSKGCY